MITNDLLKTAGDLPLHDPARKALIEAVGEITRLTTNRSNLCFALARIGYGEGTADQYSKEARNAIKWLAVASRGEAGGSAILSKGE